MQQLTLEWIEKAEGDYSTALREYRARKAPNYDAACFHAQQCVEKYLKAWLQENNIAFGKTHDLIPLGTQILSVDPLFVTFLPALRTLNVYAVDFRYPGRTADKIAAKEAVSHCTSLRKYIRQLLGLT